MGTLWSITVSMFDAFVLWKCSQRLLIDNKVMLEFFVCFWDWFFCQMVSLSSQSKLIKHWTSEQTEGSWGGQPSWNSVSTCSNEAFIFCDVASFFPLFLRSVARKKQSPYFLWLGHSLPPHTFRCVFVWQQYIKKSIIQKSWPSNYVLFKLARQSTATNQRYANMN